MVTESPFASVSMLMAGALAAGSIVAPFPSIVRLTGTVSGPVSRYVQRRPG